MKEVNEEGERKKYKIALKLIEIAKSNLVSCDYFLAHYLIIR